NHHAARGGKLSHYQKALKRAWTCLRKVPIRGSYVTDVKTWTCDCGAQKYHAYLLCKHLVKAAGLILSAWWQKATRYHIPPFYTIPIKGVMAAPPETMRNHSWKTRRDKRSAIIPRAQVVERPMSCPEDSDSSVNIPEADGFRASLPISSSPDKAPPTGRDGLLRTRAGGGTGFELDDEEELEIEDLERCLRDAIKIIQQQAENPEERFMHTAVKQFRGTIAWVCGLDSREMPSDLERLSATEATVFLTRALT
ncbi:hypothetical protein C8Q73DRAFT_615841, partial [Cubamyces lactineus]